MNKVIKKGVDKYTLKEGQESGVENMSTSVITTASGLKISYVNPNTSDELADELVKIFAKAMYNSVMIEREKRVEKAVNENIKEEEEKKKQMEEI